MECGKGRTWERGADLLDVKSRCTAAHRALDFAISVGLLAGVRRVDPGFPRVPRHGGYPDRDLRRRLRVPPGHSRGHGRQGLEGRTRAKSWQEAEEGCSTAEEVSTITPMDEAHPAVQASRR